MRSHRKKNGFTLAELLIVVAVIAVLVGVAVPIFINQAAKAKEAACMANRRTLFGEIVMEHTLSDRSFSDVFNEYVVHAGKCPSGGTFSWQDSGDTGIIKCSFHDGGSGGGGGSGSAPVLHGTANLTEETFKEGAVIQDGTGTCVILSNTWPLWTAYSNGASVAELAALDSAHAVLVNTSDIKDSSFTGTFEVGDLYYHSATGKFYYVRIVDLSGDLPQGGWVELAN